MTEINETRVRFARLRNLDNYLGGADTFRLYLTELAHTEKVLAHSTYTNTVGIALIELAAEQAQQAGWAAFDSGHTTRAIGLQTYSHHAAEQARNSELVANALIQIAYATTTPEAVDAADAAAITMQSGASAKTAALLESRRALASASNGDAYHAEKSLDAAHTFLDRYNGEKTPHWSAWINRTELDIATGRVWAVLHEPSKAIPALQRALSTYPDHWARDKALYSSYLADAHLDARDLEQASVITEDALRLASGVASPRPLARIREVVARLVKAKAPRCAEIALSVMQVSSPIPTHL